MATQTTSPQSHYPSLPQYNNDTSSIPTPTGATTTPQIPGVAVDNLTPASARHLQQAMAARAAALSSVDQQQHQQQPSTPSQSSSSLYPGPPSTTDTTSTSATATESGAAPQYHLTSAPPVDDAGLTATQIAARKLKASLPPDVAELIPDELPAGIDPETLRYMSHAQLRLAFKQPQVSHA